MDFWQSAKEWVGVSKKMPKNEGNRSQYSLVSCGELTEDTLQLWLGLPDEVKNDPSLAPFRKLYEKEHGKIQGNPKKLQSKKRLPAVNSAPLLSETPHIVDEIEYIDGCIKNSAAAKLENDVEKERKENVPILKRKSQIMKTFNSMIPMYAKCTRDGVLNAHIDVKTLVKGDLVRVDSGDIVPADIRIIDSKGFKMARGRHYVKMTLLLACWVFFTACFMMYNEKKANVSIAAVSPGETREFLIPPSEENMALLLKLTGPFISKNDERRLNASEMQDYQRLEVWLQSDMNDTEVSKPWLIPLLPNALEPREDILRLNSSAGSIKMRSTSDSAVAFTMSYTLNPLDVSTGVMYALVLLCGLYVLIIFEVINRTMAAVVVSTLSLAALASVGERPTVPEVVSWLDIETLLLLFSMMLLVAIMAETGIFDFLAVFTFEVTKGHLWPLIYLLCGITAVVSTFLDNVTTVLLMSPVTIRLCEVMDLDPVPILMFMAIYSNIGGTATPVGDPPCVIVASNKHVIQAGINFTNFTAHMALGIVLVAIQTSFQIKYMFRDTNKLRLNVPREIQDLRHQISIWRRAAESLPQLSNNAQVVRERLERKIQKLTLHLDVMVKETRKRACPRDEFQSTLAELKKKYKIRDKGLLVKASVAIIFAVAVFFLHSIPELDRISLGWTALLAAILLLILADREDLEPILRRVEWSTLLFFAALFVLMEALSKLGLIQYIGGLMEAVVLRVDEGARLAVAIMLILWVGGVISAFVDNLPMTTMMVRVVISMGSNPNLDLPLAPLVWALLYGACLGGNGTLIGASANVVCAGVAEQHGYKFTFSQFFKVGFPIMIGHLAVASGYLLICHCVFTWH